MKKIIIILLLLISTLITKAQQDTSSIVITKKDYTELNLKLNNAIQNIKYTNCKISNFETEHTLGVCLSIMGIAISTLSYYVDEPVMPAVYFGTAITIGGAIVSFDSYKHLRQIRKKK